jgi:hypothetical protein
MRHGLGKGLAAHLEVPLPYLLFRAQVRYEEDLRGIQGVIASPNPLSPTSPVKPNDMFILKPSIQRRLSGSNGATVRSPDLVRSNGGPSRGRVPSFSNTSSGGLRKTVTSSTLTLRGAGGNSRLPITLEPPSDPVSDSDSSSDEEARKNEEADREQEAQAELSKKLKALEVALTVDTVGLLRSPAPRSGESSINEASSSGSANGTRDRGRQISMNGSGRHTLAESIRMAPLNTHHLSGSHRAELDSRSRSQSVSSASSPQGSIPSIPSPQAESMASSRYSRPHMQHRHTHSHTKSISPSATSPRSTRGQMRYQTLAGNAGASEQGSSHGSSASSFSDISG